MKELPFLWGAATSSHQVEGGNIHNDWWQWEMGGKVEQKARSGKATDHWERFREDLRLAKELKLNAYRFSVEWSRVEPKQGEWNQAALERYLEIVLECKRLGLVPMVTLHHFTLPFWLAEKGGVSYHRMPELFLGYVKRVSEVLGPHVPLWCTFNEPLVLTLGAYLGEVMPPAKRDPELVSRACHHILRAHVLAYDHLHSSIKTPIGVGIAHNMVDFYAARRWHPIEQWLVRVFRRFYNRAWIDAVTGRPQHFGINGLIPYAATVPTALGRKTVDFIGVNYYMKAYIACSPIGNYAMGGDVVWTKFGQMAVGISFASRSEAITDMGWAVHPYGLGRMLRFLHRYGFPIYVTENGIADGSDKRRPGYLFSHLKEISRSHADVRGYFYWSLLDNFEWAKGFAPRFGLLAVDYDTLERSKRTSALLFQEIIEAHANHPPTYSILKKCQREYEAGTKKHLGHISKIPFAMKP